MRRGLDDALVMFELSSARAKTLFLGSSGPIVDSFGDLACVDVAFASNLDTSTAGILKPTQSGGGSDNGAISQATGTVIGDMTVNGGNAAAFDGTTSQTGSVSAGKASTSGYVGKDFSASPRRIYSATFYGASDQGYVGSANPSVTLSLYGKNGSAPTGPADGAMILLATTTFTDTATTNPQTITSTDKITQWRYVVGVISTGASQNLRIAELVFNEATAPTADDMTVTSVPFIVTGDQPPTSMYGFIRVNAIDAATPNTDYTLEFSRSGTLSWEPAELFEYRWSLAADESRKVFTTKSVDLSNQPASVFPMWRFKTLNNKNVELHNIAVWLG